MVDTYNIYIVSRRLHSEAVTQLLEMHVFSGVPEL